MTVPSPDRPAAERPGLIPILAAGVKRTRREGKHLMWVDMEDITALLALAARLSEAEKALEAIARNAEDWHGPPPEDSGHVRALAVIAGWARDPSSVPLALSGFGSGNTE